MIKTLFITFLFLVPALTLRAQEPTPDSVSDTLNPEGTDEQLAAWYMQNRDYEKAAYYYEKLFEKKPIDYYYSNLLNALLESEEGNKAEKLVRRQMKRNPLAYTYQVDMGYVYSKTGNQSKAEKEWDEAIDRLQPSTQQVNELATAFLTRDLQNRALETYRKGRKLLKNQYPFSFEIAGVLAKQNDKVGMINELLDVLLISESYTQQVQNHLSRQLMGSDDEEFRTLLHQELLRRSQKNSDKPIFYELLIWYFMQERDFGTALIHAKALDKRQKENGGRVYSLSRMAVESKNYEAAIKGYEYLIEKGENSSFYLNARIELLQALYRKITEIGRYTSEDLTNLRDQFQTTLSELGKKPNTAPLILELAHLYGFYLDDTETAVDLLDEIIAMPGVKESVVAETKMKLADILLIMGDIWEASLLYSQVDKAFKHDPIGDEAKFRNAKLSYYTGDFKWAQAQLDVLKGSTSKLIANDALQLSLLITDNSTVDTNTTPLMMFARAELLSYRNQDEAALTTLDSINQYFPGHELGDDILFRKAKIMEKKQEFKKAAEFYENVMNGYSYDILGDDAMFRLSEMYEHIFNEPEKAKDLYQRILTDHPGSLYVIEARKRFRNLRGDILDPKL